MRRPLVMLSLASVLTGLILFSAALGTLTRAQPGTPGEQPTATPPTFAAEDVWTPEPPVNPEGTPLPMPYVTKVTFPPGTWNLEDDAHLGPFTLLVSEGAICYTYSTIPVPATATVIANIASSDPIPAGCDDARTDCMVGEDCILAEGEMVYLPAGSWISQSSTAAHEYGNVDSVTAVVYVTGYWADLDGTSPCGSGCPKP